MPDKSLPAAVCPLCVQRPGKVDHHNGILLDYADKQDDTYDTYNSQIVSGIMRASKAPTPAEGSVDRIVTGWI